jgi:hypothetical protein
MSVVEFSADRLISVYLLCLCNNFCVLQIGCRLAYFLVDTLQGFVSSLVGSD